MIEADVGYPATRACVARRRGTGEGRVATLPSKFRQNKTQVRRAIAEITPNTKRGVRELILPRYRTGAEGRISHLKCGYGMRRSRIKDDPARGPGSMGILTHNLDTLTIRTGLSRGSS